MYWVESQDAAKHLTMLKTSPHQTQNYLASNGMSTEAEKSWLTKSSVLQKHFQLPPGHVHLDVAQSLKLSILQNELIIDSPPPTPPVTLPSSIFQLCQSQYHSH